MSKYSKITKIGFYPFFTVTGLTIEKLTIPSDRARQAAQLSFETFFYATLGLTAVIF